MALTTNEYLRKFGAPKDQSTVLLPTIPPLRFLRTEDRSGIACYQLLSIDRAMEQAGIRPLSNHQSRAGVIVAKIVSKVGLMRNVRRSSAGPTFVNFMGFSESKTLPFSYWTEIIPYCFDCWPSFYERWTSLFKRHRVRIAFFSARQSAQYFADALPNMHSVWLPEAVDPDEYCPLKAWAERDVDVLELGRRNDAFHNRIVKPLAETKRLHLFERVKGQIIFPLRSGLVDGLGRSKLLICFPCSQTHPDRSGSVETVTYRYFQSIASKCLILGHAPQELIELFSYNPVIEVQQEHEFEQIVYILNNLDSYQGLVERNYRRLLEVGTWKSRVTKILDTLQELRL